MTLFVAIGPYLGALVESFETFARKRTLKHSKKGPSLSSITEPGRGTIEKDNLTSPKTKKFLQLRRTFRLLFSFESLLRIR